MTTTAKPYNRAFHVMSIFSILAFTGLAVFFGFQYSAVQASNNETLFSLEKLSVNGLPGLEENIQSFKDQKAKLSTQLNPLKLREVNTQLKSTLEKANADYTYLVTQKVSETYASIQEFQSDIAKAELIDIPSKTAVINNVSTLKDDILSNTISLKDLNKNQALFLEQQTVFKQEFEAYQKNELVRSLSTLKLEATDSETFLLSKQVVDKKVFENFAKINSAISTITEPSFVEKTKFTEYKTVIDTTVIPVIKLIRADVEAVKQEEVAQREQLFKAQQELFANQGKTVPEAPIKGESKLIYVNLASQTMYLFDNDKLIETNYITSGRSKFETPPGKYAIYNKEKQKYLKSPFKDIEYNLLVQYWMPFYDGYGIHDAYWRTVYGGDDYTLAGSHGCLNTPLDTVKFIYNWAPIGTTVLID
jgi:lipoprotein-anchoring transpeptidase ErfK/SrfK